VFFFIFWRQLTMRKIFTYTTLILAVALIVSGCSRKQKGEGDVTDVGMHATDVMAGQAIPELPAVYFEYDSFNLTAASKRALQGHAQWLLSNNIRVTVEGHCDERGTTEYNLALGERRAATVRDFLVGQGVPANRINTISFGEERPLDASSGESAWSKNRRAEFVNAG